MMSWHWAWFTSSDCQSPHDDAGSPPFLKLVTKNRFWNRVVEGKLRESWLTQTITFSSQGITALFGRVSVAVLTLLALIWMALIFDFADIVGHLGAVLNHLDGV